MDNGWMCHNPRNTRAIGEEGEVCTVDEHGSCHSPTHAENYDATDGRHNRADHQGWESVDPRSGATSDTDFEGVKGRFVDGPGPWRQT